MPAGKRDVLVFDNGHDKAVRGFGIRKYRDGRASYFVKYTINGQPRRHTLGPVRRGNLEKMRSLAEDVKAQARSLGKDIVGERKAKAAEQQAAETAETVGALVDVFLAGREEMTRKVRNGKPVTPTLRHRTHDQSERYLKTHCAPLHTLVVGTVTQGAQAGVVDIDKHWTPIKLEIIARNHVAAVVDDVAKTRGKVAADRCKTALSTFFVWAIDQGFCDLNPTLNIKNRAANGSRERVLTDQELTEVWRACGDNDHGRIGKLLILTGQRKAEIGDLHWTEVNLGERVIKLPSERVKNKRAHVVPLSAEAVVIIKSIPVNTTRDLVFGRGTGTFGGWTASKVTLDKRIAEARGKAGLETIPHWAIHDLRRTFSTRANELGLGTPWLIEAVPNHVVGGVHGTYNRADHEARKREVLERWGAHVGRLVNQQHTATPGKPKRSASRRASVTTV